MNFNIMKPIYNAIAESIHPGYKVLGLSLIVGELYTVTTQMSALVLDATPLASVMS